MNPDDVGAFAVRLQRLMYKLIKTYEQCDEMCLAQFGVTSAQGYTLLALPDDADVSMNELSESMGVANSTMTRMVDQLVRKELVYRRHDEEDRRVVRVELTAQGLEVRQTLAKAQQEFLQEGLREIPAQEHAAILQAFETLTKSFAKCLEVCGSN
ncbi:MAG: MarR family transcriptional regulator [Chloroflexota bacterium]|nr:MAG: MarR family transcriptional regulator [Chloroflexota bacterium]